MKEWKAGLKVGVVLLAVFALGYWAFKRVHEGVGSGGGYVVRARFRDATGLVAKSRVVIAGLRVGEIVGKRLVGKKAEIRIRLKKKYVLYANACIFKKSASLMGEYYLEIDPGTPTAPNPANPKGPPLRYERIRDGGEIQCVHEAASMDDIMRRLDSLAPEVQGLVHDLRKIVRGPLAETVNTTNRAIKENAVVLRRVMEKADSIAADIKAITGPIPQDVRATIRNVRILSAKLNRAVEDARALLQSSNGVVADGKEKLLATLDRLQEAADKLNRALDSAPGTGRDIRGITRDIKKITGRIAEGRGNLGKFLEDESIVDNVTAITDDLKTVVKSVTALHTIVTLRSEYNVLAGTVKNYVAIRLQPKFNKYYLIELVDEPRGTLSSSETVLRQGGPDGPVISHTSKETLEHNFRFSFMFAKRIDFATFRFGIKESTGGIGVDLHFLNDTLNLSTDIFDFAANEYPRLRFRLSWEFYKRISIVAGVDDVLNGSGSFGGGIGRDYFVGAQLTFDDEDLKTLLLFAGSGLGSAAAQ